jgi:hypothetical protein
VSLADRLTKEFFAAATAIAAAALVIAGRVHGTPAAGPLPKPPPPVGPAEVAPADVPIARPALVLGERPTAGRDPFAVADLWEDPDPAPLPLPPEPPAGRTIPTLSIAGGRVLAPRPPRVAALPAPIPEPPSATAGAAPPAEGGPK